MKIIATLFLALLLIVSTSASRIKTKLGNKIEDPTGLGDDLSELAPSNSKNCV